MATVSVAAVRPSHGVAHHNYSAAVLSSPLANADPPLT